MTNPFLAKSGLTNKWWLVTKYRLDAKGNRVAIVKYDFDDAVKALVEDERTEAFEAGWMAGYLVAMQRAEADGVEAVREKLELPYRKDDECSG